MTTYKSKKTFFTNGIKNNEEFIVTGVIPGLKYIVKYIDNNLVYLESVDYKSIIIVTSDMLNSELFTEIK